MACRKESKIDGIAAFLFPLLRAKDKDRGNTLVLKLTVFFVFFVLSATLCVYVDASAISLRRSPVKPNNGGHATKYKSSTSSLDISTQPVKNELTENFTLEELTKDHDLKENTKKRGFKERSKRIVAFVSKYFAKLKAKLPHRNGIKSYNDIVTVSRPTKNIHLKVIEKLNESDALVGQDIIESVLHAQRDKIPPLEKDVDAREPQDSSGGSVQNVKQRRSDVHSETEEEEENSVSGKEENSDSGEEENSDSGKEEYSDYEEEEKEKKVGSDDKPFSVQDMTGRIRDLLGEFYIDEKDEADRVQAITSIITTRVVQTFIKNHNKKTSTQAVYYEALNEGIKDIRDILDMSDETALTKMLTRMFIDTNIDLAYSMLFYLGLDDEIDISLQAVQDAQKKKLDSADVLALSVELRHKCLQQASNYFKESMSNLTGRGRTAAVA